MGLGLRVGQLPPLEKSALAKKILRLAAGEPIHQLQGRLGFRV